MMWLQALAAFAALALAWVCYRLLQAAVEVWRWRDWPPF